jgi:hypothetical protein
MRENIQGTGSPHAPVRQSEDRGLPLFDLFTDGRRARALLSASAQGPDTGWLALTDGMRRVCRAAQYLLDGLRRRMNKFVKNNSGVHLTNPLFPVTFCGQILEGDGEDDETICIRTSERVVTCPDCIAMILHCRGVRLTRAQPDRVAAVADDDPGDTHPAG